MGLNRGAIPDLISQDFSKIFDDSVKAESPIYDKIFKLGTSTHKYEKMSGATGLPLHTVKEEGADAGSGDLKQKYDKTFTHTTYAMISRITKEAFDDDLSGQLKKIPKLQGISARQTIETLAAQIFDRSQTAAYTGPDGKVLCATDHPRAGDGGTWSNRPTTNVDLSVSAAEDAVIAIKNTEDDWGNPMHLMPRILYIPIENINTAIQLTKNQDKAGTANRDVNALMKQGLIGYIVGEYLTDADSWYYLTDPADRQLMFLWREKINEKTYGAPDNTDDAIFRSRFRISLGWVSARGIYGSVGI